jgi:hypothetical protein
VRRTCSLKTAAQKRRRVAPLPSTSMQSHTRRSTGRGSAVATKQVSCHCAVTRPVATWAKEGCGVSAVGAEGVGAAVGR